jgi:hypothetical protein
MKNCQITSIAVMSLFVWGSSHELPGQLWPPSLMRYSCTGAVQCCQNKGTTWPIACCAYGSGSQ